MKTVLFACIHNAGRSQMAAAWFNALANPERARGISAGTAPGTRVHPEVLDAMREVGIDLSQATPRFLSTELAESAAPWGAERRVPQSPGCVASIGRSKIRRARRSPASAKSATRCALTSSSCWPRRAGRATRPFRRRREAFLVASTTFETASAADLNVIRALLSASELPIDDVGAHIAHFVLARREGATIGTVAVEYAGDVALLRSLCVTQSHRGEAVGVRLLAAIEAQAASRGVRELYLLTTSAAAFFEHHGFSRASREEAPEAIRSTAQFRTLCPSAAVCMRKTLPSSSTEQSGEP